MGIILSIIIVFAVSIIVLAFYDLKLSIAFYTAYLILVPYLEFKIGGVGLSYNMVNAVLLLVFFYQFKFKKKTNISLTILRPFIFLFASLFVLTFFAYDTPWILQFDSLRLTVMRTCIVVLIIWNFALVDSKILNYIKTALIVSFSIACLYGIYLMNLGGLNPYVSFLSAYFGSSDAAEIYSSLDSRFSFSSAGKIQSTMVHPMTWSLHICFMICIVLGSFFREKKNWYKFFFGLLIFNLLISGVRTGIAALVIAAIYFLLVSGNKKVLLYAIFIGLVGVVFINVNNDLANLFQSFTDFSGNKSDVKGSSITMRLDQLQGAIDEVQGRELFGKGYGWTVYYQSKFGDHPILLAFESLIFVVLCNNGIIGLIVYSVFFLMLFKLQRKILSTRQDIYIMDAIVITYLSYAIGTGEYGYLQIFSIYYVFLICSLMDFKTIQLRNNNAIYGKKGKSDSLLLTTISPNS